MTVSIDKSDMYRVLESFPEQCKEAIKLTKEWSVEDEIDEVVVAGMGGSAIAGDMLKAYLSDTKLRITVVRDYTLPSFIGEKTLFFAMSYSGNTEETISAYREAVKRKARIVCVSTGGKLQELAKMNENEFIKLPMGLQPRCAVGYLFFPLLLVLQNSRLIPDKSSEIKQTISKLQPGALIENAKHLAGHLQGKTPIIYTSTQMRVVGYRWKCQFNENAKIQAYNNVYPEFNHNEINGYVKSGIEPYVIQLMDDADHPRVQKRMNAVKEILISKGISVTTLALKGNKLYKLLNSIYLGDWISYFVAIQNETDPTPVDTIENLKKILKD